MSLGPVMEWYLLIKKIINTSRKYNIYILGYIMSF